MSRQQRKSLLEIFWSRLKQRPAALPATSIPHRFQAVSIYCGMKPCPLARRFRDHRFLAKDAPQLPLTGCTRPHACDCRFLKHKDRRAERRRFTDFYSMRRDFTEERRRRPGRRGTD